MYRLHRQAVNDTVAEGDHTCTITTGDQTSTDTFYGGLGAGDVDDVGYAIVAGNATVTEGDSDSTTTFTITRSGATQLTSIVDLSSAGTASDPADYTLTSVTGGTTSFSDPTVTFNASDTTATVTVTIVDDDVNENDETIDFDLTNAGGASIHTSTLPASVATTTITDDDTAGLNIINAPTNLTEGDSSTFTLNLDSEPTSAVTVDVSVGSSECTLDSTTPITLDSTDYNTAIDNVSITVPQDDTATSDSFTVELTTNPNGTAIVELTVSDAQTEICDPSTTCTYDTMVSLTFISGTYDTPQIVQVIAVDDIFPENDPHIGAIAVGVSATTGGYDTVIVPDIDVNIADNDQAGVSIIESDGVTIVREAVTILAGDQDTFDVVLDTDPGGTVNVTITADSQSELSDGGAFGNSVTFTFDSATFDTPQPVTVQAIDDLDIESITHNSTLAVAVTGAGSYNGLSVPDVNVNVVDNETLGLVAVPSSTQLEEGGSTESVFVSLSSSPGADDVTVVMTISKKGEMENGGGAPTR
jgi:hypothetical protein